MTALREDCRKGYGTERPSAGQTGARR